MVVGHLCLKWKTALFIRYNVRKEACSCQVFKICSDIKHQEPVGELHTDSRGRLSMTITVKWKLLAVTPDESEAYLLKSRLDGEGIQCKLDSFKAFPAMSSTGLGSEFKLYVPLADFEASQQVLQDQDPEEDQ